MPSPEERPALLARIEKYIQGGSPDLATAAFAPVRILSLPSEGLPLTDLRGFLAAFLGNGGLADFLPSELYALEEKCSGPGKVSLVRLEVELPQPDAPGRFFLGLRWAGADWELIPGLLCVRDPEISISTLSSGDSPIFCGSVQGKLSIAGFDLLLSLKVPSLQVVGAFLGRQKLLPLFEHFGLDGHGFDAIEATSLGFRADCRAGQFCCDIEVADAWKAGADGLAFEVEELKLALAYTRGAGGGLAATIAGKVTIAQLAIDLTADHAGAESGWLFQGEVATEKSIDEILKGISDLFGLGGASLPPAVAGLTLTRLSVAFNTRKGAFAFGLTGKLPDVGTLALDLNLQKNAAGGYDVHFDGKLLLGTEPDQLEFDLIFDRQHGSSTLLGVYKNPGGGGLSLKSLVAAAGGSLGDGLDDLDLTIKDVLFAWQSPGKYLFALDMDAGIDFSGLGSLPLIGKLLPADQALRLSFEPIFASASAPDLSSVQLPEGGPAIPAGFTGGFKLIATLRIGDFTQTLDFGSGAQGSGSGQLPQAPGDLSGRAGLGSPQPAATAPADPAAGLANTKITWVDLQKSFGPLHFQRLGVGFHDGKIDALLDASLGVGPLSIGLVGLGAEYDLATHALGFSLDGMAIDFQRGPLEIGAAFLRCGEDFAGRALLRTETLSLGALGAYGEHGEHGGHPSLFVYAFVDYPIGGPAFFFVEGLSAGFGFNRRLIVPPVDQIASFPLVAEVVTPATRPAAAQAMGDPQAALTGIRDEIASLERYIPPRLGDYFLAAGIKFNTFRLIDSFALLVLSAGRDLEIDVIGISKLVVPSESPEVLAEADLAFVARFQPLAGSLAASAQLTPSSYVLAPECRLQGGFAFGSWFLGPHAGDFVYSMGGYHPAFHVPDHYPRVPRLGFSWRLDGNTQVKGGLYYALTPAAAMAGGNLTATWESGSVKAWFDFGADFLIAWKPFHYSASAEVEIGAALTIHCFGSHDVTLHVDADLELWGPPFGGRARVKAKVLTVHVDFAVELGSGSRSAPAKIQWADFAKSFLPKPAKICTLAATHGLVGSGKLKVQGENAAEQVDHWVVNAKDLRLVADSAIPASLTPAGVSLGIEPMGVAAGHFASTQAITVNKGDLGLAGDIYTWAPVAEVTDHFALVPLVKQVPRALWSPAAGPASRPDPNQASIAAVAGQSLHPKEPPKPGETCYVRDGALRYEVSSPPLPQDAVYAAATGDAATLPQALETALAASTDSRRNLLDDLGFDPAAVVALGGGLADSFVVLPEVAPSALQPIKGQS